MTLSKPIKIAVGVATLLVVLIPVGLILLWLSLVVPLFMAAPTEDFPFQYFDMLMPVIFSLGCLINILIYGMVTFYIIHAIKNQDANDIIRIILLVAIFFIPYLGMPIYYVIYILMSPPPAWALKQQSTNVHSFTE